MSEQPLVARAAAQPQPEDTVPTAADQRLRVAVAGATGRMGRELIAAVLTAPDMQLTGALTRPGDVGEGRDAGAQAGIDAGVKVTADIEAGLANAQVLIDFTRPEGSLAHLRVCHALGVHAVIGTTGFSDAQRADITLHSQSIGVVLAPNMSPGVHAVMALLDQAARLLGSEHDVEIIEAHHRHKVDAPSGTALKMGQVIAAAIGRELDDCAVTGRHGTGARKPGSIGFASVRGGDIVGDHTVVFAGDGERIEITHRSGSRQPYADGSLRAARFVVQQRHGLFGMADVLAQPASATAA